MKPTKEEIAEIGKDQREWALYDIDENLQSFKIKVLANAYKEAIEALEELTDAAENYAADQSDIIDSRTGNVQPISKYEGELLNEKVDKAAWVLDKAPDEWRGE